MEVKYLTEKLDELEGLLERMFERKDNLRDILDTEDELILMRYDKLKKFVWDEEDDTSVDRDELVDNSDEEVDDVLETGGKKEPTCYSINRLDVGITSQEEFRSYNNMIKCTMSNNAYFAYYDSSDRGCWEFVPFYGFYDNKLYVSTDTVENIKKNHTIVTKC